MAGVRNPAGRLHTMLSRAAQVPNTGKLTVRDVLKDAMGISEASDAEFLRQLGLLYSLPGEVREQVSRLPSDEDHELYLRHLHRFEEAMQFAHAEKWTQRFWPHIAGEPMQSLEYCSARLDRERSETPLEQETLDLLGQHIDKFQRSVIDANIADDLRRLLVRHLQTMRLAVDEVRLRGAVALRDAAEAALGGALVWSQVEGRSQSQTSKEKSLFKHMVEIAAGMLVLISAGKATVEIGQEVYKALPTMVQVAEIEHERNFDDDVVDAELVDDDNDNGPNAR